MSQLMNSFLKTNSSNQTPKAYEFEEQPALSVSLGIFAAILFGSLAGIFLIIGGCMASHRIYMKYFKKPWYVSLR
jgi:hypothetical protein